MAKQFIYSDPNIYDTGAVTEGTIATTTFASSDSLTNHERVVDQNISSVVSSWAQNDAIQIDMGADSSPNVCAIYMNTTVAESETIKLYASDTTTVGSEIHSGTLGVGWNIIDVSVTDKRYFYVRNTTASELDYVAEILVGTKYTFDRNFDLGGQFGKKFGVSTVESYGGHEYSHKRHDGKQTWKWEWTRMTNAHMNNLITLRDAVEGSRFKFIYYDETDYHWVRMSDKSLQKKEIAYQTFNTNIELTQQLT
jgi:hypothetical protein